MLLFDWIQENTWLFLFLIALIEAIIRYVPSASNYSIFDRLYQLLIFFLPKNRTKGKAYPYHHA